MSVHQHSHAHSHGLVHPSVKRSREGLRVVGLALLVLAVTAAAQLVIYLATDSVALLADLIHNAGDAFTAIPLALAFVLRSARGERIAGLIVVAAILVSAITAAAISIERLIDPVEPTDLTALVIAGLIGVMGNEIAARIRIRGGNRIESPALIADGYHARTDGIVSGAVVVSAILVALGMPIADPLIGLAISALILKITWESWQTIQGTDPHHHLDEMSHEYDEPEEQAHR